MEAIEVTGKVNPEGQLILDSPLKNIPNSRVRVIILVPDSVTEEVEEETQWSQLTAEQFFAGYSDTDAIYDQV